MWFLYSAVAFNKPYVTPEIFMDQTSFIWQNNRTSPYSVLIDFRALLSIVLALLRVLLQLLASSFYLQFCSSSSVRNAKDTSEVPPMLTSSLHTVPLCLVLAHFCGFMCGWTVNEVLSCWLPSTTICGTFGEALKLRVFNPTRSIQLDSEWPENQSVPGVNPCSSIHLAFQRLLSLPAQALIGTAVHMQTSVKVVPGVVWGKD